MTDWDAVLVELRAIRVSMDKIAALVAGEQTRADLMPVWACGHRHATRAEAICCRGPLWTDEHGNSVYLGGEPPRKHGDVFLDRLGIKWIWLPDGARPTQSDNLVPPNADAGAFG